MSTPSLICIVDDDADYRLLLQLVFNRDFPAYAVRFFSSGTHFLAALPQLSPKPALILLDRHMPLLDGHQTLLVLKEDPLYKKIPVVMMSAHASIKEINGCYEAGANSFLIKPVDPTSFQGSLSTLCHYWLEMNQIPTIA